jgi:hypothetical protein
MAGERQAFAPGLRLGHMREMLLNKKAKLNFFKRLIDEGGPVAKATSPNLLDA